MGSIANGENATATGQSSFANGTTATALGQGSVANANAATALGQGSLVASGATGGTAVGQGAQVFAANGTALGQGAVANFANSTAIGAGASTTAPNQMSFGTASNTYTMLGITSPASKAAQTGPLQIVTSDAGGNLATNTAAGLGLATTSDISSINSQLNTINARLGFIDARLNDLDQRVNRVGAQSAALAGLHPNPRAKGDNHISAAFGNYNGQSAFAAGYFRHIGTQTLLSAGVATAGGNNWSANTGLTFSW
jgi:hypothetical protein